MTIKESFPSITIVSPSYNQASFVEATLDSVLSQNYPNLEYIVVDGGSKDGSVEILRRYERYLSLLLVEPDRGSAHAINKGLKIATGEWFNWLNTDDILLPGALHQLSHHIKKHPDRQWISGCKCNLDINGAFVSSQAPWREDLAFWLLEQPLFPQDATFIRTEFLRSNNIKLNEELANVYDTVLYLELLAYSHPLIVSSVFSAMRWHADQKTANWQQRAAEAVFIKSAAKALSNYRRVAIAGRLCSSRIGWLVRPFLSRLAKLGLWPSRLDWTVEQYDVWTQSFHQCRIRDVLSQ